MRVFRILLFVLVLASSATAQEQPAAEQPTPEQPALTQRPNASDAVVIPAGTKVPLVMKHAITTKSARAGDGVYLETMQPVVLDGRILIPEGSYVQGKLVHVKRPGKVKGRGELMMHLTTLVMPQGYMVQLPGAVDSVAGSETGRVKDEEGTVQNEGQKGRDAATVATTTGTGTLIGLGTHGGKGAGIGAGAGAAVGVLAVLLTRGNELRIEAGTMVEMELKRDLMLDRQRVEREVGRLDPNYRRVLAPNPPATPPSTAGPPSILNPTGPR
jgi:type IV secretion system protein VirB10